MVEPRAAPVYAKGFAVTSGLGMTRAVLANASWMMIERVVTMAVNLVVTLWLAHALGPEVFGQLAYVLAAVTLVLPLAALGVNDVVTRELVEGHHARKQVMATTLGMRLIGAILGLGLLLAWVLLADDLALDARMALAVLALASVTQAVQVVRFFFQAQLAHKPISLVRSGVVLVSGIGKILVAWWTQDLFWIAAVFAADYVFTDGGLLLLYRQATRSWLSLRDFSFDYARQLFRQTGWLLLSGVAAAIYLKIDQIMLGHMTSDDVLGNYALAARLSEAWYFLAVAIVSSYFTVLMKHREERPQWFAARVQQLVDAMLLLSLSIAVVVSFASPVVVPWLFGAEYQASAAILAVHIWAGVFVFMRAVASKWLLAKRYMPFSLVTHGLGAVFNVAANLWLIPRYGGMGAALATVLAYAMAGYFSFWCSAKTRPMARQMTHALLLPLTLGYRYWRR
ncbi:flippase [Pseudidiomarina sp. CB1]|uniref:flippase n=1 Tax=Pseudidiomarina sp. CB1 TaxID=2972484 RepID=UPI002162BC02|nr:flippase [Pseudidiomarina sp. CB1]